MAYKHLAAVLTKASIVVLLRGNAGLLRLTVDTDAGPATDRASAGTTRDVHRFGDRLQHIGYPRSGRGDCAVQPGEQFADLGCRRTEVSGISRRRQFPGLPPPRASRALAILHAAMSHRRLPFSGIWGMV